MYSLLFWVVKLRWTFILTACSSRWHFGVLTLPYLQPNSNLFCQNIEVKVSQIVHLLMLVRVRSFQKCENNSILDWEQDKIKKTKLIKAFMIVVVVPLLCSQTGSSQRCTVVVRGFLSQDSSLSRTAATECRNAESPWNFQSNVL